MTDLYTLAKSARDNPSGFTKLEGRPHEVRNWRALEIYCSTNPERIIKLCERVEKLEDRLNNGIQYNSERNEYVLVWTEREIEQAQKEADEICRKMGILPEVK